MNIFEGYLLSSTFLQIRKFSVMIQTRGVAGGRAARAAAVEIFENLYSEVPSSGPFVFPGCHANI